MPSGFRHVLKDQTGPDHARLDARLSAFDVRTFGGSLQFLKVHYISFLTLKQMDQNRPPTHLRLQEMVECLRRDLDVLGDMGADPFDPDFDPVDPLALDYVIEGSRLGAKVLGRKWATSTDPRVQRAGAYFAIEPIAGQWGRVCKRLDEVPAESTHAAVLIHDTRRLFSLFNDVTNDLLQYQYCIEEVIQ